MKNKPLYEHLENELTLRSLFEKSPLGIAYHRMVYDKTGKPINYYILEANSTYQKLTRTIEPVGKLVTDAFPGIEQDPFDWIGVFGEVAKTGKEIRFQQHLQFNDRWYDLVAYRNKPDHFVATFFEITDHRIVELELQEKQIQLKLQNKELKIAKQKAEKNENELRKAQEIAHVGSWSMDVATNEVAWTEELYKMYGFDPTLPVPPYTEHMKLFTAKSWEILSLSLAKTREQGIPYELELQTLRKDGSNGWMWVRGESVKDAKGKIIGLCGAAQDITDRKQVEEELIAAKEKAEESEANYRILVETMPDGVYKSTHAGKFITGNPAMIKMLGYDSIEEFLAVDIKNDLYIEDYDRDNIILDDLNQELGVYQLRKKDGSLIWVEDHGWYSLDKSSKITYHEGIIRDVTERIQKEQELIKAKEKAEESDRLKSAFLANMSHEIRTPMNGIMGFASLLKEPNLTGEEQQNYIDIIEKSGERMLSIINDIISISKIEAGMMEVNWQESNINEQIDYIYTFFRPEVERKGMQLSFRKSLPLKESIIKTDLEKVYAILTNLVKNAIKYSENGSIEFGYNKKDHYLEFYVTDTGIGIPEERQAAIFERFIQADITDRMALQGAGLGLSISKAYVEMLGGKIWVESEVNKGSTFYFTLPYQCEKKLETNNTPTPSQVTPTKKLKILIAEDDESSRVLLSIIVKKFGHESTSVTTGTDAVAACFNNPDIDLVIMDILMPEMSGYEATRQIRKFNKDLFIIAQTAYALEGEEEKAIAAGCNGYITKPIKPEELKQMIDKYLIEYLRKL